MNAWEDHKFRDAVRATGRKRLVMGGIVTSNCLAVAAVSALTDGYEVMFIEDAWETRRRNTMIWPFFGSFKLGPFQIRQSR